MDCIYLSAIFLLTCIPIFTIGAALTSLYYTVQKVLKNDRGYVGGEYWHAFKTNFKQSTCIWLIVLLVGVVLMGDVRILKIMDEAGNPMGKGYIFFQGLLVLLALWCSYVFPYVARFENKTKAIMKNAAFMAVLNLPRTFLILVYMVVAGLVTYIIPIAIMVVPALFTLTQNRTLEKVFRKYMNEEDRAAEDEIGGLYLGKYSVDLPGHPPLQIF